MGGVRQQALEGFDVRQLEIVRKWRDEGRQEGRVETIRDGLLTVLRKRFPPGPSSDLATTIQQTTDLDTLSRWFDAALEAPSLEEFLHAIKAPSSGTP